MLMLKSPAIISLELGGSVLMMICTRLNRSAMGAVGVKYKFVMRRGIPRCKRSTVIDSRCFVAKLSIFCNVVVFMQHVSRP